MMDDVDPSDTFDTQQCRRIVYEIIDLTEHESTPVFCTRLEDHDGPCR